MVRFRLKIEYSYEDGNLHNIKFITIQTAKGEMNNDHDRMVTMVNMLLMLLISSLVRHTTAQSYQYEIIMQHVNDPQINQQTAQASTTSPIRSSSLMIDLKFHFQHHSAESRFVDLKCTLTDMVQ